MTGNLTSLPLAVTSHLLELAGAARAVSSVPKPATFQELERQIDMTQVISAPARIFGAKVLLSAFSGPQNGFLSFSLSTPHLTECIATLVGLLGSQSVSSTLLTRIIKLLQGFASNQSLSHLLSTQFNLLSVVTSIMMRTGREDLCTKECLRLLQSTTYGVSLACPNGSVEDIVKYSLSIVLSTQSSAELSLLSLEVLANLSRRSQSVQAFLKALPSADSFQRRLIANISGGDLTLIVVSLQILASLFLTDHSSDLGERVFCPSNTVQSFQLAFSILSSGQHDSATLSCAVDLFVDILACERTHSTLKSYPHLDKCLSRTLGTLPSANGGTAAKVLELCLAMCRVPGLRGKLVHILLHPATSRRGKPRPSASAPPPREEGLTPLTALLAWACRADLAHRTTTFRALDMLKETFEEVVDSGMAESCGESVNVALPMLVSVLEPPSYSDDAADTAYCLTRTIKALSILSVLWSVESFVGQLSEHVHEAVLGRLIRDQLDNNPCVIATPTTELPAWSADGIKVLILTFELCLKHRKHAHSVKELVCRYIQSPRLLPLLAHALLHCERRYIAVVLQLAAEMCTTAEAQLTSLADALALLNTQRDNQQTSSLSTLQGLTASQSKLVGFAQCSSHQLSSEQGSGRLQRGQSLAITQSMENSAGRKMVDMSSIESLIERFRSGLELKELKSSEIIEIYEHKLQAMSSKEGHLQDLIDAKALALAQADRLIAQYRGRKAQSDEECLKLRLLLKDAEKKSEGLKEECLELRLLLKNEEKRSVGLMDEVAEGEVHIQQLTLKMKQLQTQNSGLQQVAQEHRQLTEVFRQQTAQLELLQSNCHQKQQEFDRLQISHVSLQRQNTDIQAKYDTTMAQADELQREFQCIEKQLQCCESKSKGLQMALDQSTQRCRALEQAKCSLEEFNSEVSAELRAIKNLNAELSHKKLNLEGECASLQAQVHQLEESLGTVEQRCRQLQEEVNLFSAVKNLINKSDSRT